MSAWYVYTHTHIYDLLGVYTDVNKCVKKRQTDDIQYHPYLLSILFFEIGSLPEPAAHPSS